MRLRLVVLVLGITACVVLAPAHSDKKFRFKVLDYIVAGKQRIVLLQPVISYSIFGYPKDNSAIPQKGEILSCALGQRKVGVTTDVYGKEKPPGDISVLSLDCGAVSLDVGGIDFE